MKKIIAIVISLLMLTSLIVLVSADYTEEYFNQNYSESPYWCTEFIEGFERFHNNSNEPRLVDWAGIFTDEQKDDLNSKLEEFRNKYNVDLVIYTDDTSYGASWDLNARDFYDYNGYGLGDNFSGSIWFICMDEDNRGRSTQGTGDVQGYFTSTTINALDDDTQTDLKNGNYYSAATTYIEDMEELYSSGTVTVYYGGNSKEETKTYEYNGSFNPPGEKLGFTTIAIGVAVAAFIALFIGLGVQGAAVSSMKTVATANEARNYIVPGSLNITSRRDHFLFMTQTKVYSPKEKSSSGKGGSSFSSGSSGGGGSFSGGGRGF